MFTADRHRIRDMWKSLISRHAPCISRSLDRQRERTSPYYQYTWNKYEYSWNVKNYPIYLLLCWACREEAILKQFSKWKWHTSHATNLNINVHISLPHTLQINLKLSTRSQKRTGSQKREMAIPKKVYSNKEFFQPKSKIYFITFPFNKYFCFWKNLYIS